MKAQIKRQFSKSLLALTIGQILSSAQAETIVVNSSDDVNQNDSVCTLREAVISANTNPAMSVSGCVAGEPGLDTIDISAVSSILFSQTSAITVSEDLIVNGAGTGLTTNGVRANGSRISGGQSQSGVFTVDGATLTINSASIIGNSSTANFAGGITASNNSSLILNDVFMSGNVGVQAGAISIMSGSTLTMNAGFIHENRASSGAGGIFVSGAGSFVQINDSTISSNFGGSGFGGVAAYDSSQVEIRKSTFNTNAVAIHLDSAQLDLFNSTLSSNESDLPGSGLSIGSNADADVRRSTFHFNGSLYGGSSSAIAVAPTGTLSIQNSLVTGNLPNDPLIDNAGTVSLSSHNLFGDNRVTTVQAFNGFVPTASDITATADGMTPSNLNDIVEPLKSFASDTEVHKLYRRSPAIDAGDTDLCLAAPLNGLDQRGVALQGACDIGAFELTTSIISVNDSSNGSSNVTCTFANAIEAVKVQSAVGGCVAGRDANEIRFDQAVFPEDSDNRVVTNEVVDLRYADVSIYGQGRPALTIDAGGNHQVFSAYKSSLELDGLVITGGDLPLGSGAGVRVNDSRLTISNSMIAGNTAGGSGGGVASINSIVSIESTTISNNEGDFGGGLAHSGNAIQIRNSTVSGNRGRLSGGGLSLNRLSYIEISNSTITNNYAQEGGGIEFVRNTNRSPKIVNTIVAGNDAIIATEMYASGSLTLAVDQNNIFGDSAHSTVEAFNSFSPGPASLNLTSDAGQSTPIDRIIRPLDDNGGVGLTHELARLSSAIDAGNQAFCQQNMISLDQRGVQRDSACDIGAIETQVLEQEQCFVVKAENGNVLTFCL